MNLRRFALAFLALCATGALTAGNAAAENLFEEGATSAWYVGASGGTKLAEGTSATLKARVTPLEGPLTLRTSYYESKVKIEATGMNCVGCVIKNVGSTAEITGRLELNGMKLIEPQPQYCSVPPTVTSRPLVATASMRKGSSTVDTIRFVPENVTKTWFEFEVSGQNCGIFQHNYEFRGSLFAEPVNATGTFYVNPQWKFGRTVQESAGTLTSFVTGFGPAFLEGSVSSRLESEMTFALKEK